MNWIDRPIEPTKALKRGIRKPDWSASRTRAYRERRLAAVAKRKREHLERIWRDVHTGFDRMPPTKVLTAWHVDETGCRARTVGCD